ncbi:CMRF35-like molecule 8 [Astyanax mexicanus]|uniref:CMRF35-like molecule 8 n=1 Tax=Astyanax mexicanus TaxID=7994 RepID=UPI0020CB103E|nr:CMRF35-like molecule 8 [Astyanax mexicanus]
MFTFLFTSINIIDTSTFTTTSAPDSSVAISLSIVLALLLIGGAALVFFIVIRKKKQGSTPSARTNHSDHKEVPAVVSNDEETGLTTQTPPKDQEITYSTLTPPKDQEITYSTVSFHKNPGSSTDASVRVSKEEPETEYAIIKRPK